MLTVTLSDNMRLELQRPADSVARRHPMIGSLRSPVFDKAIYLAPTCYFCQAPTLLFLDLLSFFIWPETWGRKFRQSKLSTTSIVDVYSAANTRYPVQEKTLSVSLATFQSFRVGATS